MKIEQMRSHTLKIDQVVCCKMVRIYYLSPFVIISYLTCSSQLNFVGILALAHYHYDNTFSKFQLALHNTCY